MSKVCEFCGKHAVAGRSISHSHRVVNRTFKPNIQRVTVVVDGHRRKAVAATSHAQGVVLGRPPFSVAPRPRVALGLPAL